MVAARKISWAQKRKQNKEKKRKGEKRKETKTLQLRM
jgi:hypothetical protein